MSDPEPPDGEEEEVPNALRDLDPNDFRSIGTGKAETERRKRIMPFIAAEYLNDVPIEDIIEKYDMPEGSIHYYFNKMGVTRKRKATKKAQARKSTVQKEIRAIETKELSLEAEKIATIAIGIGGPIARRYLPLIDTLMSEGMTLEFIAEDVMGFYEQKVTLLGRIARLEGEVELRKQEASDALAMSMPNFRYLLRVKVVEKYANQLLRARMFGVKIPVKKALNAMNVDLLRVDTDIKEIVSG